MKKIVVQCALLIVIIVLCMLIGANAYPKSIAGTYCSGQSFIMVFDHKDALVSFEKLADCNQPMYEFKRITTTPTIINLPA